MPARNAGAPATGMPSWCFVRPLVDLCLAGGLTLATFALALAFGPSEVPTSVYAFAGWVQWVINWPHFAATN